jgi:hypothetical protein
VKECFKQSLLIFEGNGSVGCSEIDSENLRAAYDLDVVTANLFYETELQGRADSTFPGNSCFLCDSARVTAAEFSATICATGRYE